MSNSNDDLNLSGRAMIDVEGISKLCVSVNTYALKLKKSLDVIGDLIEDSNSYFSGDTKDDFMKKLNDIMKSKTRIKNNILSYIDDYNTVVSEYMSHDSSITFNKINGDNGGK